MSRITNSFLSRRRLLTGASRTALLPGVVASLLTLALPGAAWAQSATLPTGGTIVQGTGTIATTANRMDIHQGSATIVTNWTGFDIGADASVVFHQPDASSLAINRVTGGGASQILGHLSANGQIWLLNPRGILFGKGAAVDVGGLVASSLNLSDADAAARRLRLTGGTGAGAITNEGQIATASGGVVALIGPAVTNGGSITSPGGSTVLAAGDAVSLDFAGDGLVSYRVERGVADALVSNRGVIGAAGGMVVLTARGADAVTAGVVNNSGEIRATALVSRAGRIVLDGDTVGGSTNVSGTIDASSSFANGGIVTVTGGAVALTGATIDASGATGGGTVSIGGGRHGEDSAISNALSLTVDDASVLRADAVGSGNGGTITAWSDGSTRFAGTIFARGGRDGGDGGQIEVSGKQELYYAGVANALAPNGRTGDLLLDPTNITIEGGAGTSGNWSSGTGDVTVYAATLEAQTANVLLEATRYITFNDLNNNGGDGDIVMQRNVSFRAETMNALSGTPNDRRASIRFTNSNNTLKVSGTGSIYMNGGGGGSGYGTIGDRPDSGSTYITPGTGTFNLIAGDAGDVGDNPAITALPDHNVGTIGNGTPGAGSITLLGADGILISGNITTHGGYVRISGDSDVGGGGAIQLTKNITTNGGNLYVYFGNSAAENFAEIGGEVRLGTGRLVFGDEVNAATNFRNNLGASSGVKRLSGLLELSGNVNFSTPLTMLGGANIRTDGDINFTSTVNFNTGNESLTLRATNISFAGATLQNASTASLVLEPYDPATNINLDGNDGIVPANSFTKLSGIRDLTIGRLDGTGTTTISSSGFAFGASRQLTLLNGAIQVDGLLQNTNATGTIVAQAGSTDVTIGSAGQIKALGTGTAVIAAAARNFVNDAGAGALSAANGRWLTYSTSPLSDTRGGLATTFKQYAATYGVTSVAQATGNGQLYTVAPLVTVSLIGSTTKAYDGTTAATLTTAGNFLLTGAIDGDDLGQMLTGFGTAAYADRNAGTGKLVTATGLSGGAASNGAVTVYGYALPTTATGTIGTITPRAIAATFAAADKVYDGTTAATVTTGFATGGVLAGDSLSIAGNGTFADRNAGIGKTVAVSGLTLSGADAGNYQLLATSGTTTASITPRAIAATFAAADKVYDGTTAATITTGFGTGSVLAGDSLAVAGNGTFADRNAGIGKAVSVFGLTLSGADAGNYRLLTLGGTTTASITPRTIAATFAAGDKVYDGTTAATVTANFAAGGVLAGDSLTVADDARFDTSAIGFGKSVQITGIKLIGADSGNYRLSTTTAEVHASIQPQQDLDTALAGVIARPDGANGTADTSPGTATPALTTTAAVIGGARITEAATPVARVATGASNSTLLLADRTISTATGLSLLTADPAAAPERSQPMAIYTTRPSAAPDLVGTFVATDSGNAIELEAAPGEALALDRFSQPASMAAVQVETIAGTLDLQIGAADDATLLITVVRDPSGATAKAIAAYGLAAARKKLAMGVGRIKAIVILSS